LVRRLRRFEVDFVDTHEVERSTISERPDVFAAPFATTLAPALRAAHQVQLFYGEVRFWEDAPAEDAGPLFTPRLHSIAELAALPELQSVRLDGAKQVVDIESIGNMSSLTTVSLRGVPLPSFASIGRLAALDEFTMSHVSLGRSQMSAGPLTQLHVLRVLKLWNAKTLTDVERLGQLRSLEVLMLFGIPALPSLAFLGNLTKLRSLAIGRPEIGDGDLGVLLELPRLERVEMIGRANRHYSHSLEEINAALSARMGHGAS
jgi:hypothetical protein